VALTPTAVERIAQAIHALRPQWPIASLETFLRDPKLANRPTRDVAIALTWIAVDPDTRTPARVHEDGAWWRAATVDEAQTYRNPGTVCTIHPSQLEPCRHCTAQRVPANLERGTRNLPLALARAELAQTRANTCAHGILKGHEKAAYMLEARALVDRADDARSRYRLAWLSARRRARFAADVVDAEILCGSVDHGWECGLPDGHQGPHCGHPPGVRSW
jgi:hypothetical protein